MHLLLEISVNDGLVTALIGAVIAAIGYLAKLIIEAYQKYRERRMELRSQLAQLHSMLKASRAIFIKQHALIRQLTISLSNKDVSMELLDENPEFMQSRENENMDIDTQLASRFDTLIEPQKELFRIIRGYTMYAMLPANDALLKWVQADRFFKAQTRNRKLAQLAGQLCNLEAHLLLWNAKYQVWIPGNEKKCHVYLADNKEHGVPFPRGIDKLTEEILGDF